MRLECHRANTTPGSLRNLAQIRQRSHPAAKRKHKSATTTDAAGVPLCEHNTGSLRNLAQIRQRSHPVAKRKHKSASGPKPSEQNHRCGWSATVRTQHEVPFATWHKYVNGQTVNEQCRPEGRHCCKKTSLTPASRQGDFGFSRGKSKPATTRWRSVRPGGQLGVGDQRSAW